MAEARAIGIDFGLRYCRVAVYQCGKFKIIVNNDVACTHKECLIGDPSKDCDNTIFDVKRIIGRELGNDKVPTKVNWWPDEAFDNYRELRIEVSFDNEPELFYPEIILSIILVELRDTAEAFLGKFVQNAVITVPSHFNASQRQAVKDAANIARLNVLDIITGPLAVAVAYNQKEEIDLPTSTRNVWVLVFDLDVLNVSVVRIKVGEYSIISTVDCVNFNAEDFDNTMVNHFIRKFECKYRKDLSCNEKALRRLKTACDQAKNRLSKIEVAQIIIKSLHEGIDFHSSITRVAFDKLNADLYQNMMKPVKEALRKAGKNKAEINNVLLVGNSSGIPKVQEFLQDFFNDEKLVKCVDPGTIKACGAAVEAILTMNRDRRYRMTSTSKTTVTRQSTVLSSVGENIKPCSSTTNQAKLVTGVSQLSTRQMDSFLPISSKCVATSVKIQGIRLFEQPPNILDDFRSQTASLSSVKSGNLSPSSIRPEISSPTSMDDFRTQTASPSSIKSGNVSLFSIRSEISSPTSMDDFRTQTASPSSIKSGNVSPSSIRSEITSTASIKSEILSTASIKSKISSPTFMDDFLTQTVSNNSVFRSKIKSEMVSSDSCDSIQTTASFCLKPVVTITDSAKFRISSTFPLIPQTTSFDSVISSKSAVTNCSTSSTAVTQSFKPKIKLKPAVINPVRLKVLTPEKINEYAFINPNPTSDKKPCPTTTSTAKLGISSPNDSTNKTKENATTTSSNLPFDPKPISVTVATTKSRNTSLVSQTPFGGVRTQNTHFNSNADTNSSVINSSLKPIAKSIFADGDSINNSSLSSYKNCGSTTSNRCKQFEGSLPNATVCTETKPTAESLSKGANTNTASRSEHFKSSPGVFTPNATVSAGTSNMFIPVIGTDIITRNRIDRTLNTKLRCITGIKEIEIESLKESRYEYLTNRKGPYQVPVRKTSTLFGTNTTNTAGERFVDKSGGVFSKTASNDGEKSVREFQKPPASSFSTQTTPINFNVGSNSNTSASVDINKKLDVEVIEKTNVEINEEFSVEVNKNLNVEVNKKASVSQQKTNQSVVSNTVAIGIDLGTTNSCVGVFRSGKVEIIASDQGSRTTASYVAFVGDERLVGNAAEAQTLMNLKNTIFGTKRLIGRKFNDASVQADIKHWPFEVIDENNIPKIKVTNHGAVKTYFPEEILSMLLRKMKETVEAYLGKPVKNAVITVPSYFNNSQRQAIKDAATIAGLDVLRIINEPTAAAIAYGLEKKCFGKRNVLVFNLGAGTFDVSILNIKDGIFEVKSTAGDTHLGGEDFDNQMVNYLVEEFKLAYKKDLSLDMVALCRLKTACEQAKKILSSTDTTTINLDSLYEGIDLHETITRARFEELNANLFKSIMKTVEKVICNAEMDKDEIDDVILVGGCSRIPKVQKLLRHFFNGKELNNSINPDEAVAYGAAVQAAILNGDESKEIRDMLLLDVTPLSLGVCTTGIFSLVVERNTPIPLKITKDFCALKDNQPEINFNVFEGEFVGTALNELLGEFTLTNITQAPATEVVMRVIFHIDANGILNVSAVEKKTGKKSQITIAYHKNRLSKDEIERIILEAEEYKMKEKKRKFTIVAKRDLKKYCAEMKAKIEHVKLSNEIDEIDTNIFFNELDEFIQWLDSQPTVEKDDCELKRKELKNIFNLITAIVSEPDKKLEKYFGIFDLKEGASEEEIRDAFKRAALKYHPDKCKKDKEFAEWMFLKISVAKDHLIASVSPVPCKRRKIIMNNYKVDNL